jgi:hypothetical protein
LPRGKIKADLDHKVSSHVLNRKNLPLSDKGGKVSDAESVTAGKVSQVFLVDELRPVGEPSRKCFSGTYT